MEESKLVPVMIDSGKQISVMNTPVETKTFGVLELREEHLEAFLDENLDILFSGDDSSISLLPVGRQVPNEFGGECDLVAIDSEGCIVIIEIKRDPKDCKARVEAFEMQAIRYASSFALIESPDDLAEQVYVPYLRKYKSDKFAGLDAHDYARSEINGFLRTNNCLTEFNNKQKIILVASGFDPEAKSACAWLVDNGIDLACIQITPLTHSTQNYLLVDRIIPPPVLKDMFAKIVTRKAVRSVNNVAGSGSERTKRTKLMTTAEMIEQGLISKGDIVIIKDRQESKAIVEDSKTVTYQGRSMTWNAWAKLITEWSAVNIYANVYSLKYEKTLDEIRNSYEYPTADQNPQT